ncbi:MAG: response regulator [Calothrix sp. SM1_5_4]|nr:response regulator [Calothrix sp. SM1_5_4]
MNVLLIEDDENHAEIILNSLNRNPETFNVHVAMNKKEAQQKLETITPEILITDLKLPDGLGTDFIDLNRSKQISGHW